MWQVSILTTAEAEEAVAAALEREFQLPPSVYCHEATGARTVTSYPARLPGTAGAVRTRLRTELRAVEDLGLDAGPGKITVKPLPRENWAESWKRHFKPIEIDHSLLIKPGWIRRRPRPGQKVVVLDPGLSFGTGHHHTTYFCLRQLSRCRISGQAQSFLDIGTGSGILAIAAAKLGYSPIAAFDNDPAAVLTSRKNVKKNRVQHLLWPKLANLETFKNQRKYDVICANLAHDLLIQEASKICSRLSPGGRLIVAGILKRHFEKVAKNFRTFNLTLESKMSDRYWKSGQFVL